MGGQIIERNLIEGEGVQSATGAAYSLQADDLDATLILTNATAVALTVPPDATIDQPVGAEVRVIQGGAGKVTVTPGAGVTLQARGGLLSINGQFAGITLTKVGDNIWNVSGDTVA